MVGSENAHRCEMRNLVGRCRAIARVSENWGPLYLVPHCPSLFACSRLLFPDLRVIAQAPPPNSRTLQGARSPTPFMPVTRHRAAYSFVSSQFVTVQ